ncbi:hypothetical protein JEQ12_000496 [Ovis aries]|uniref:Spermatogenesis-associated protein 1 C-terminal domain-containing protein n=1 Tax=Ovis aries TaxID=9940 RepID=A0A836AP43_SHEEP|nr:hypothetical protein JEQ12_000496 [Ovis aries]
MRALLRPPFRLHTRKGARASEGEGRVGSEKGRSGRWARQLRDADWKGRPSSPSSPSLEAELGEVRKEVVVILRAPKGIPKRSDIGEYVPQSNSTFFIRASAGGKSTPNENQFGNNQTGNPELPGSQEDSDNDYFSDSKSQFLWKNEDDRANIIRREDNQLGKTEYIPIPDLIDFPSLPCQPALSPGITDIPLSQIETCGVWKKRCFETKKVTASLEEVLTKLREDLELYYKKLLMQLEVREIKMRPKNLANITDSKNYLIIQITEVQHAIDQLKRKLDTDKMKLIIEIKEENNS